MLHPSFNHQYNNLRLRRKRVWVPWISQDLMHRAALGLASEVNLHPSATRCSAPLMTETAQPAGRRIAVSLPGALDRDDVKHLTAWCLANFIEQRDSVFLINASTNPSPAWVTGGEARAVEYKAPHSFPSWVPEALVAATAGNKEVKAFELDATSFTPVDAILDFVQALGVDVLLIGSRARGGVAKTVLFSSSSYLAEYADTVPVLVVRGTPPAPATELGDPAASRQIALTLDGTDACRRLAAFAMRTVLRPSDRIYIMHSPYDLEASQLLTALTILEAVRSDLLSRGFTNVFPMELDADIDTRDALVDQLQAGEPPFTLCIVGSRGLRGALKRMWMGSVSSYVTSHSPCPVLIVPPGVLPVEQPVEQEAPPPA